MIHFSTAICMSSCLLLSQYMLTHADLLGFEFVGLLPYCQKTSIGNVYTAIRGVISKASLLEQLKKLIPCQCFY